MVRSWNLHSRVHGQEWTPWRLPACLIGTGYVLRKTASKSPVSGQVNQCLCIGTKYCQILHLSRLPSFGGKNRHSKKLSLGFLNWVSERFYVPFARKSSIFPVESLSLIRSPRIGGDPICYVSNEQAKQKGKTSEVETVLKTCEECSEGIHTNTCFSSFLETMEIPPLLESPPFLPLLSNSHPKTSVLTAVMFPEWNKTCLRGSMGGWLPWTYVQVQSSTNI